MPALPFSIEIIQWLADHRSALLTVIFQAFSFSGDMQGYILIIALIYVAYEKRLAVRLAVLALFAMSLNHALKTLIRNPRPFVSDGTYLQKWAVSPDTAADLATEYSTPSGHAMASASFYGYLIGTWPTRAVRLALAGCVLMIGASRPYLGVHYVEDILSGWLGGFAVAYLALRYGPAVELLWDRCSYAVQVTMLLAASLAVWLATRVLSDWATQAPPTAFISYAGLLTGIVAAYPLEARLVGFDPRSGGLAAKLLRYLLCVAIVLATLAGLKSGFSPLSLDSSPLGHLLRFLRYATAGFTALFVAPALCVRLGLASSLSSRAES